MDSRLSPACRSDLSKRAEFASAWYSIRHGAAVRTVAHRGGGSGSRVAPFRDGIRRVFHDLQHQAHFGRRGAGARLPLRRSDGVGVHLWRERHDSKRLLDERRSRDRRIRRLRSPENAPRGVLLDARPRERRDKIAWRQRRWISTLGNSRHERGSRASSDDRGERHELRQRFLRLPGHGGGRASRPKTRAPRARDLSALVLGLAPKGEKSGLVVGGFAAGRHCVSVSSSGIVASPLGTRSLRATFPRAQIS